MEALSHRCRFFAVLCSISLHIPASGGSGTIGGGGSSEPSLSLSPSPSFVIADWGVRHDFKPIFIPRITLIGSGGVVSPPYVYRATLTNGPPGLTISEAGVLEWIPGAERVGEAVPCTLHFSVSLDGAEIFTSSPTVSFNVRAGLPTMQAQVESVSYERIPPGGSTGMIFEGYQPNTEDRKLFRWSLVGSPPGVFISPEGYLTWPDDRGYAREEPYNFTVRIEYDTPRGGVSNEAVYSRRILPEQATNDFQELKPFITPEEGGRLGYSMAEGDGWLAAGEPTYGFGFARSGETGRVRLWRFDPVQGRYQESIILQPTSALGSDAFGASVSISETRDGLPTRLAVGAPESDRLKPDGGRKSFVGSVEMYALDATGNWQSEGRLDPPAEEEYLYFGGWVSVSGNILIASMEGEDSAGEYTGALAVFQHNGTSWVFLETLIAPDPAYRDFFSYPCATDGEWIAAAANEDDDDGMDAGAVHLYQKMGNHFVHRQRLASPMPQAGGLFGERLLLDGSWLFVSAFRENNGTGAVHVFKRNGAQWDFQQTLVSPFAEAGSSFGVGLAISGETLSVSAPANLSLIGASPPDDGYRPWKGITLFSLEGGIWKWSRQVTDSPDGYGNETTWGFALAQPSPEITIASIPDSTAVTSGYDFLLLAGRAFLHRWPARIPDPFSAVLSSLPIENGQPATANGDANGNGVPNLIEWMMGYDPAQSASDQTSLNQRQTFLRFSPPGSIPFVPASPLLGGLQDRVGGGLHLIVPQLTRGLGYRLSIESSDDLNQWREETTAKWEALETIFFPVADGFLLAPAHPVGLKMDDPSRFYRLSAASDIR